MVIKMLENLIVVLIIVAILTFAVSLNIIRKRKGKSCCPCGGNTRTKQE